MTAKDHSEDLTSLQKFQIDRLARVLARRAFASDPRALLLIDSSIASLYLSCIDAGVGDEALQLIDAGRRSIAARA